MLQLIRRNVLSKFTGELLSRAVFLVFFFYLGRRLSTAEFGVLNLVLSTTYIFGVAFLDPGLNFATVKILVAQPERSAKTAGTVLLFKILAFAPMLAALWMVARAFPERLPTLSILLVGALYTFCNAILDYLCYLTNAYHRMDLEAWFKIANRLAIVLISFFLLRTGSVGAVLWSMCIATALSCIAAAQVLTWKCVLIQPSWQGTALKAVLWEALPIAGFFIVGTIYVKWDLLVLSYFKVGRAQIGWYAGAFKIVEGFSTLPTMLGSALFPLMIQLRSEPEEFDRLLRLSTKALLLLSIPVAAIIGLFSRYLITLVYGAKYAPAASVLAILIWSIVPMFLYFYLTFVNIASGHAKYNAIAGCVALAAGFGANAILVPRLGFLGAAWSALIAHMTFAIVNVWRVSTVFRQAGIPRTSFRLATAGACMAAIFFLLPAPVPVQLFLGLLAYLIVLIAFGSIGLDDFYLASKFLSLRRMP